MNVRDSEIISHSLAEHNYIETLDIDSADLIILNTCSIRAKAEQKVMSMLGYLRKNKKRNPDLKICVAGCVAQQAGKSIIDRMPHVNLVVGTQHIYKIPELLTESDSGKSVATTLSDSYAIPHFISKNIKKDEDNCTKTDQHISYSRFVTIMQGCNNYCTYCVVPFTRGREVSRYVNDIVEEVKGLVDSGVKEITLLGQNVNSYGLTNSVNDHGAPFSFAQLLVMVSKIKGLERLRFTTSNPKDLSEELILCFKNLKNLCPQFHLPVQSGSDKILKLMNRKYSIKKYLELVHSLRKYSPDIVITTDMIIGFPGETVQDFDETMELLEVVQFDGSFSFKYSDRPGTASAEFDNKVPEILKSERLAIFQKRQDEISLSRNNRYIGKHVNVMVESIGSGDYKCRAVTNHVVHVQTNRILVPGDNVLVEIFHAGQHSLKGRMS